jgi:predicted phosphate transport protein (TIGR00153 family)
MRRFFIPKEYSFFEIFDEHTATLVDAAQEFLNMLENYGEAPIRANTIQMIEHRADEITHRAMEMLHKTFVTPIDRDLILKLITQMDDVVDLVDGTAKRMLLYGVKVPRPDLIEQARVLKKSTMELQKAVHHLRNLKHADVIQQCCIEIKKFEDESDTLRDLAVARLFSDDQSTREILVWKEIYETVESAVDRCDDVAGIIWSILLESA